MLSIIAAVAQQNVIGKDNQLIWHLPEDLKRFKALTTGKTIIMGRKTFESLGRVLPNRKHVILTHNRNYQIEDEQVQVVYQKEDLQPYIVSGEECFVIGGESIYRLLMPEAQKLYITQIHAHFEGDTFFPEIDETVWKIVKKEKGLQDEKNPYDYEYVDYIRK